MKNNRKTTCVHRCVTIRRGGEGDLPGLVQPGMLRPSLPSLALAYDTQPASQPSRTPTWASAAGTRKRS